MLVLLSLGLEGFFLVCLRTLENATFMCCSTVVRWKYLQDEPSNTESGVPTASSCHQTKTTTSVFGTNYNDHKRACVYVFTRGGRKNLFTFEL